MKPSWSDQRILVTVLKLILYKKHTRTAKLWGVNGWERIGWKFPFLIYSESSNKWINASGTLDLRDLRVGQGVRGQESYLASFLPEVSERSQVSAASVVWVSHDHPALSLPPPSVSGMSKETHARLELDCYECSRMCSWSTCGRVFWGVYLGVGLLSQRGWPS